MARRFGDDCGQTVIVDGAKGLQQAREFRRAPASRIGDALPLGESRGLGPIGSVLTVVSSLAEGRRAMARLHAPSDEQPKDTGV